MHCVLIAPGAPAGHEGWLATRGGDEPGDARRPLGRHAATEERPPCRLLIVEDDWFVSLDMETALRDAGHQVLGVVVSGEEAVEAARAMQPDLVIMDIRLAGKRDGVDAAIAIREQLDIPSLFLTAYRGAELAARAEAARPVGWLTKPITGDALVAAVEAWR